MILTLVNLLCTTLADHSLNCKLNCGIAKCSNKCVGFDKQNVKDCAYKTGTSMEFTLLKTIKGQAADVCEECFQTARLLCETAQEEKAGTCVNLSYPKGTLAGCLKNSEKGFVGVKTDAFYVVSLKKKDGPIFERFKFTKLKSEGDNSYFTLTDETFDLPKPFEASSIVYFSTHNMNFLLADFNPIVTIQKQTITGKIISYSQYLYYVFLGMSGVWVILAVFRFANHVKKQKSAEHLK